VDSSVVGDGPGDRYAQVALAEELARVAAAPVGQRNRRLWESTRNLYNLVAVGALDHREVDQGLLAAADRCGLLGEEPQQTRRTLASGRQVGLAHPRPAPTAPTPTPPMPGQPRQPERAANEPGRGGEDDGRRRPPDRLALFAWGGRVPPPSRARAHPPPRRGEPPYGQQSTPGPRRPSWDLDGVHAHLALPQRPADARPTTRELEQPSTG
jgi:hypothetical protein